jgi:hypothetical protein
MPSARHGFHNTQLDYLRLTLFILLGFWGFSDYLGLL